MGREKNAAEMGRRSRTRLPPVLGSWRGLGKQSLPRTRRCGMLGAPRGGRGTRGRGQSPTVCAYPGLDVLPGPQGGDRRPPRGRAGRTECAPLRPGTGGGPMSLVRGWREVSPVRRQQIIVVVEFISPSSLCFCSRVTCCVLTSGHPHHSPAFSSRPRAMSCPGVPSSHTLQGSPVWGGLTSGYPSRLSSSAAPHSLGTRVGLCTIPFLSCILGFAVPRVPASVPNPPPAT